MCRFSLRPYRTTDLDALALLFYETVHSVNAADYTPAQLDAWAGGSIDRAAWDGSLRAQQSLVAVLDGRALGFADLDIQAAYLDRLYVHRDWQGRGVATALCNALEQRARIAGLSSVRTCASITARPFFEKRGYALEQAQLVQRHGVFCAITAWYALCVQIEGLTGPAVDSAVWRGKMDDHARPCRPSFLPVRLGKVSLLNRPV